MREARNYDARQRESREEAQEATKPLVNQGIKFAIGIKLECANHVRGWKAAQITREIRRAIRRRLIFSQISVFLHPPFCVELPNMMHKKSEKWSLKAVARGIN